MGVPSNRTGGSNSSEIAMSPLVEMQATAPHTLTIRITPRPLLPGMGIRVSYERVPHHYPARHQQASSMAGFQILCATIARMLLFSDQTGHAGLPC